MYGALRANKLNQWTLPEVLKIVRLFLLNTVGELIVAIYNAF